MAVTVNPARAARDAELACLAKRKIATRVSRVTELFGDDSSTVTTSQERAELTSVAAAKVTQKVSKAVELFSDAEGTGRTYHDKTALATPASDQVAKQVSEAGDLFGDDNAGNASAAEVAKSAGEAVGESTKPMSRAMELFGEEDDDFVVTSSAQMSSETARQADVVPDAVNTSSGYAVADGPPSDPASSLSKELSAEFPSLELDVIGMVVANIRHSKPGSSNQKVRSAARAALQDMSAL